MAHPPVIVVGVDRSPQSLAALRWAVEEARRWGAALRIVHAWLAASTDARPGLHEPDEERQRRAAHEHQATMDWAAELLDDAAANLSYTVEAIEGAPGPVLSDIATTADLLIVGTGEHVGLDRVVHGSVSHHCVGHASCPVVSVPSHVVRRVHARPREHARMPLGEFW